MPIGTLLVAGASGDVGTGIVRATAAAGWTVVGVARNEEKLALLGESLPPGTFYAAGGDISTEDGALKVWETAKRQAGRIDAVVVSVNAANRPAPLLHWTAEDLGQMLRANLLTHFIAAKIWLQRLPRSGTLLGIGGGTADFVLPQLAHLSMAQAAQRMLYRGLAKEHIGGARVCELMLVSMINGASKRAEAKPEWITENEVGRHVCAILSAPELFPGPILHLKNRAGVGIPHPGDSNVRLS